MNMKCAILHYLLIKTTKPPLLDEREEQGTQQVSFNYYKHTEPNKLNKY